MTKAKAFNAPSAGQARTRVDPEIAPLIDALPIFDLDDTTLGETRIAAKVDARLFDQRVVPVEVLIERGTEQPVRVLLFEPPKSEDRRCAILHLHGGGMVFGSADMARVFAPEIVLEHEAVLVSVDYRLAPETRFPGQIEDAAVALRWMIGNAEVLAIDPRRIFLMGESAGGGLVAGLALMLRDTKGPRPAGQILTYPMLDHRTGSHEGPVLDGTVGQFIWTAPQNKFGWEALKGDVDLVPPQSAWFSPALAKDLFGLPPTFLAVGNLDLFLTESIQFARRLRQASVPTELHLYRGALHGFDLMRRSKLAAGYRQDLSDWLNSAYAR